MGRKAGGGVKVLHSADLDRAVARGAAYYGLVRRGKGVRIRGGTARAYYVGVETSLPAVPGAAAAQGAVRGAVRHGGRHRGATCPARSSAWWSASRRSSASWARRVRRADTVGTLVEEWEGEIEELSPLTTTLEAPDKAGQVVPVHLHSKVTEVGTLELWCISRDSKQNWKLEFNVRERAE